MRIKELLKKRHDVSKPMQHLLQTVRAAIEKPFGTVVVVPPEKKRYRRGLA